MLNIDELEAQRDNLLSEIANLEPRAESGQDWASLCDMYQELTLIKDDIDKQHEANGQFGVGA